MGVNQSQLQYAPPSLRGSFRDLGHLQESKFFIHVSAHHQGLSLRDLAERSFCNRCGTALTFEETSRPAEVDVTVGSLDRLNELSPKDHIWTESRLSWLHMNDGLPEYPQASPRN